MMNDKIEEQSLEHLANIEEEIGELTDKIPGPKNAFFNGILQGMGVVLGSLLGVALLGWILSFFGVIPGLEDFADYVEDLVDNNNGR